MAFDAYTILDNIRDSDSDAIREYLYTHGSLLSQFRPNVYNTILLKSGLSYCNDYICDSYFGTACNKLY